MAPLVPPAEAPKNPEGLGIKPEHEDEGDSACSLSPRPLPGLKKEDIVRNPVILPTPSESPKYLPLYTVQLKCEDTSVTSVSSQDSQSRSFFVVDLQVRLLLGLDDKPLLSIYPRLVHRLITLREKERLWSPLASMVSERCATALNYLRNPFPLVDEYCGEEGRSTGSAIVRIKNQEKRKFVQMELYFVKLDDIVEIIKRDYKHLSNNLMTTPLDIGYSDADYGKGQSPDKPASSAYMVPANVIGGKTCSLMSSINFRVPAKFAHKMAKTVPRL